MALTSLEVGSIIICGVCLPLFAALGWAVYRRRTKFPLDRRVASLLYWSNWLQVLTLLNGVVLGECLRTKES